MRVLFRLWIGAGALLGCAAVALSAVAAHVLPARLDTQHLALMQTGLRMQMWHAVALLAGGLWAERRGGVAHAALAALLAGVLLFCGAVDTLALGGPLLGPMAPVGGSLLMLGWLLLAWSALRT